jgi:acetoin utilization deacetylase AcuC-like enzyme
MLKIAHCPEYLLPLPEGHRFPMQKYELIPEQLLYEGSIGPENLFAPEPIEERLILAAHDEGYWRRLSSLDLPPAMVRRIGFPLTAELVDRARRIAQGSVECTEHALRHGIAMNVAGGTHHAHADRGEGFCEINDQAIAARYLLDTGTARQILIVDLDVHQGNGTAKIFEGEPRVFTFSVHGEKNYPLHKEKSDLDIALPDGTEDAAYLAMLRTVLPDLLDRVRPDFVFYLSGVDVLATDRLGRLGLTMQGCRERDRTVFDLCHRRAGLPVAVSMGGGYSPRLATVVEAHAQTYRSALEAIRADAPVPSNGPKTPFGKP